MYTGCDYYFPNTHDVWKNAYGQVQSSLVDGLSPTQLLTLGFSEDICDVASLWRCRTSLLMEGGWIELKRAQYNPPNDRRRRAGGWRTISP